MFHGKFYFVRKISWPIILLLSIPVAFCLVKALERTWRFQLFGELITSIDTEERVVALTFDDGPSSPYTDQLLDCLERHKIKATFFVIGSEVEKYPELTRRIIARGHEVGNHSYSHVSRGSPRLIKSEVERTDQILRGLGVRGEIHFRAPGGEKPLIAQYVLSRMRKKNVLWNVPAEDITQHDPEKIARYVVSRVRPGSIILLHNLPHSVVASELIIRRLKENGYTFRTVSELIEISSER